MTIHALLALRHGQSVANAAAATGAQVAGPDHQVPLTPLGRRQAAAAGRWLSRLPPGERPDALYCSPYLRARETVRIALAADPAPAPPVTVDHRLGDREMGELELLTTAQVATRFPAEHRRRQQAGELDWRPPGGESLRDVVARAGQFLGDLAAGPPDRRIMVVAHDAVLLALRQVIEGLDDRELVRLLRDDPPRNAAVTRWHTDSGQLRLCHYNDARHLAAGDAP